MERLSVNQLHARLRGLGAKYQPQVSTSAAQVYHAPSAGRWIRVKRVNAALVSLEYFTQCPCKGG